MRGVCTHSKCLKSQYTAARHCQGAGQIGSAITHSSSACQRIVCVARQVFVANPNKTPAIVDILAGNKEKLLRYLKDFHNDTSARAECVVMLLRGSISVLRYSAAFLVLLNPPKSLCAPGPLVYCVIQVDLSVQTTSSSRRRRR
jgi:Mo25-like